MENELRDIVLFLRWLSTTGLGGAAISAFFEKFAWFQKLTKTIKFRLVAVVTVVIPLLARVLELNVPVEFWQSLQPYWDAVVTGLLLFGSSQAYHWLNSAHITRQKLLNR